LADSSTIIGSNDDIPIVSIPGLTLHSIFIPKDVEVRASINNLASTATNPIKTADFDGFSILKIRQIIIKYFSMLYVRHCTNK
jgi:hypothetical protein